MSREQSCNPFLLKNRVICEECGANPSLQQTFQSISKCDLFIKLIIVVDDPIIDHQSSSTGILGAK